MILVGSRALAIRTPGLINRDPVDFDFISHRDEYNTWMDVNRSKIKVESIEEITSHSNKKIIVRGDVNLEFELFHPENANWLLQDLLSDGIETKFGIVPSLDLLFTIKQSHRYLKNSPHFWKTLSDWHRMRAVGATVRKEYIPFLKMRERETYNYAHPKLNTSKQNFFSEDQGVSYTYDHDSIHEAVKILDRPAYRYFMKDEAEVATSKEKFFTCSEEVRLLSVVEESCVLAIERSLVPHPGVKTHKEAYFYAAMKCMSSIASGWWRQYAYENAPRILKMYPENYWEKFQTGLTNSTVKPFNGSRY